MVSFFDELNIGTKVSHKKYGNGIIINIDSDKALVDFELVGLEDKAVRGRFHCAFVSTMREGVVSLNR